MKLKKLTIEGFRGFNDLREIFFNDKLTLIYAPNSYGKTSISEAMEWLLYGITSKVRRAESKEEFKNSYRNSHYPSHSDPFVEATLAGPSGEVILKGTLISESDQIKLFNGNTCESWPFNELLVSAPEPFILQHALKNLLLATPSERFQGFASLLGLDELETIRSSVASLCTKPQVKIPIEIQRFLQGLDQLADKLSVHPRLSSIGKSLSKGKLKINETFGLVKKECFARAPDAKEENLLSALGSV